VKLHPLSIPVAIGVWVVLAELFCIWINPGWPSVDFKIPDASYDFAIAREVVLDRSSYILFLELDFGVACDRSGSPITSIKEALKQMHLCGGTDRSAPINVTWSISELASRKKLFSGDVETTISNRFGGNKWSRVAGELSPTPGKYWLEASVRNKNSLLTGLPAQLSFWSKSQTSTDTFTYFMRVINWFVLGPIALVLLVVQLIRSATRRFSMPR
jgi:hypothetical protein